MDTVAHSSHQKLALLARVLAFSFFSIAWTYPATASDSKEFVVNENYLIHIPDAPKVGPIFVSWFFARDNKIWQNGTYTDLDKVQWPYWDLNQIPIQIAPIIRQSSWVLIFDDTKTLIEESEMKEVFSPEKYELAKADGPKPAYFQIKVALNEGRTLLFSPLYIWHRKRPIASCEVNTSADEYNWSKDNRVSVCLQTLHGYLNDRTLEKEIYLKIDWPLIKGRNNILAVKETDRELRALARQKKAVYLGQKNAKNIFKAEVGITNKELVKKIEFPKFLPNTEGAKLAPSTKVIRAPLYSLQHESGAEVRLTSLYLDTQPERKIISPSLGRFRLNLQFLDDTLHSPDVRIEQTRSTETRTGLLGQMRPFQGLAFVNINSLTSNRGETENYLGALGIDVRYNILRWGLQPFASFEKQLLHLGSTLQITQLRAGASKQLGFLPGTFVTAGYQEYALSGTNSGSTRLGNFQSILFGLGASQRFEAWALRQNLNVLAGNQFSFDARFDFGKFLSRDSDERIYMGTYLGYSVYRAGVKNKLNNTEIFSESRLQIGFVVGWIGPDSF